MVHLAFFRDNYFFSEAIITMLKNKNNFKVEFSSHSLADLFYNLNHNPIDIIVLTCEDDQVDLKEVVNIIKQNTRIPIVYIQSNDDVKKAKEIQKEGVHVYLYKMTALTLLDCMKSVADKYIFEKRKDTLLKHEDHSYKLSGEFPQHPFDLLNQNQKKIICMLSQKIERHKIAESCNLSIHSVNAYINKIKKIIGCKDTSILLEICSEDVEEEMKKISSQVSKNQYKELTIATA